MTLVIVTAEPGDPPDDANYRGGPEEMLRNSVRLFEEAMERGGLERAGRPTPFHRNMRLILDCFWPELNLTEQLTRTWTTNAVLCPAQVSGGAHLKRVEGACASTYLGPQLEIFKHAFVLALGNKARDRLAAAGLRYDFVGRHPSARVSQDDKLASWEAAAERYHQTRSKGANRINQQAHSSKGTKPTQAVSALDHPSNNGSHERSCSEATKTLEFFRSIDDHTDYSYKKGRIQSMIWFRGRKVGGYNRKEDHWYLSKKFVDECSFAEQLKALGFHFVVHNQKHAYWKIRGNRARAGFQRALTRMTGVSLT
ncbi:hypothetical protein [Sulfitobacter noctilucae]|uniref:hypothetical protein n=1 Tax=Sulfitobacter noctilucae TaxID=1342302 RepID=UPI0012688DD2|nr:hypothetical protein [Sulfitobacter noctilucae]